MQPAEQRLAGTGDEVGPAPGAPEWPQRWEVDEAVKQAAGLLRHRHAEMVIGYGASPVVLLQAADVVEWMRSRIASLEQSYSALQVEHAATLAEWGARIEGLQAELEKARAGSKA